MLSAFGWLESQADPAPIPLACVAGKTVRLRFDCVNKETGAAADITGAVVRFVMTDEDGIVVRTTEGDDPNVVRLLTDPGAGIYHVVFVSPQAGRYRWESEVEDLAMEIATVGRGPYIIAPSIIAA